MRLSETLDVTEALGKVRVRIVRNQDSLYHVEDIESIHERLRYPAILGECQMEQVCRTSVYGVRWPRCAHSQTWTDSTPNKPQLRSVPTSCGRMCEPKPRLESKLSVPVAQP